MKTVNEGMWRGKGWMDGWENGGGDDPSKTEYSVHHKWLCVVKVSSQTKLPNLLLSTKIQRTRWYKMIRFTNLVIFA